MDVTVWRASAGKVFNGMLIMFFGGILAAVLGLIMGGAAIASMASGDVGAGIATILVIPVIGLVISIVGYVFILGGLKAFSEVQAAPADAQAVMDIRTAYLLQLIGAICGIIPIIGWIASLVLTILFFIKALGGYGKLSQSATFPIEARNGAGKVRIAVILTLVGVIVALIPLLGAVLALILSVLSLILTLMGWNAIKSANVAA